MEKSDPPVNVRELFRTCATPEHYLGEGAFGRSFSMDHVPGFEPYVLRLGGIRERKTALEMLDAWRNTSSLYPPPRGVISGANLGQHLLQAGGDYHMNKPDVAVLVRQPGLSLSNIEKAELSTIPMGNHFRHARAYFQMLEHILTAAKRTGENPFLPLIQQRREIDSYGWTVQLSQQNILFDAATGRLGLVDQQSTGIHNYSTLEDIFLTRPYQLLHGIDRDAHPDLYREGSDTVQRMAQLLEHALKQDKAEQQEIAVRREKLLSGDFTDADVAFVAQKPFTMHYAYTERGVRPTSTPAQLKLRLDKLYRDAEIPTR